MLTKKQKSLKLKALLLKTLFKRLYMRNGKIVRAELNEPLGFLCQSKLKNNPLFDLQLSGGQSRILIRRLSGSRQGCAGSYVRSLPSIVRLRLMTCLTSTRSNPAQKKLPHLLVRHFLLVGRAGFEPA